VSIKGLNNFIREPSTIIRALNKIGMLKWIPDEKYIKWRYFIEFRKKLNLDNPTTFNEKIQWLKLHDRNDKYTKLVDKLEVRDFVKSKVGSDYLVPLLGAWDNVNEIDWNSLPKEFVIKCTHDSGGLIICTDKNKLDIKKAKKKIQRSLSVNYYYSGREWPYKNVQPRIIAEKLLEQRDYQELRDYRFFCFHGEPKFVAVDFSINDKNKTRRNLYDMDWKLLPAEISYPRELNIKLIKPQKFEQMIDLSRRLSEGIPHVRIDFYYVNNEIIFGEMTFYHQGVLSKINPESFNHKLGDLIKISEIQ